MHHTFKREIALLSLSLALLLTLATAGAHAQQKGAKADENTPIFSAYKGVTLGMTTEEARKKLGVPSDKDDQQDFFVFNEKESAQVFYDKMHKVMALSVNYLGEDSGMPQPKAVLGTDIEAKPDGSMYQLIRYPKAGCWVSYSRTAGESPLVTVTIQKLTN
ncbi:MAG TPA: hypothetical protein VGC91_14030 [Pyrinomonadaceae bacterium]|jgi:hypothetical protein